MKLVLCLPAVFVMLTFPVTSSRNVCSKPPAMSMMLKVLRPTSKVLVECAADVIISNRVNASFLTKVVQAVCEFHDQCYDGILDIKDPGFYSLTDTEGIWIFKKMMACFCNDKDLEFEDAGVTNAVMHWIYEVLRSDA
ncbi:uncharacterized protein LOC142574093 isoform X2 [Dermacentor variabilis]|uniref:uncharacterized protein LOC142574093 isoform X2 n=1 Tax=Dermacentor variabilis TaxID=34621 RepID=UPI003F5B4ED4